MELVMRTWRYDVSKTLVVHITKRMQWCHVAVCLLTGTDAGAVLAGMKQWWCSTHNGASSMKAAD